jgi:hypothetical protein
MASRSSFVDSENPSGALQFGAGDRKLTDGTATEHRNRVARADLRQFRAEPARREDIGNQDRLIVADLIRQFAHGGAGERNPRAFRLQAIHRPDRLRSAGEAGACLRPVRIGLVTLAEVAGAAIRTRAAGDRGADHHRVVYIEIAHVLAELLDDTDALVAQDGA